MYSPTTRCSLRITRKRCLSSSSLPLRPLNNVSKHDDRETPAKNLLQLPLSVLERLLLFLDVSSLEQFSSTCSFIHQLISGRHITSLCFPFSQNFINEVAASKIIEKKPVLRLCSQKTDINEMPKENIVDYMVSSQLALLDLTKLRDLLLVPVHVQVQNLYFLVLHPNILLEVLPVCHLFDSILLRHLSWSGCLRNVSRLEMMIDRHCIIDYFMDELPNLLHLGLTLAIQKNIISRHLATFVNKLQSAVASCRAPSLTITVLEETRIKAKQLFVNNYVECLTVTAPCNFNLHLVMENLKEVKVTHPANPCTYHRSPVTDRSLHRPGLCAVNLSSVHQRCPNILTFAGLEIGLVSQQQSFGRWSSKLKKIFYGDYLARGGQLQLKAWGGRRWFRQPELGKTAVNI